MSIQNVALKSEYRSLSDDIVREFYIPLLSHAVLYRRAVGFFSSSALIEISKGISQLVANGGKIQLIVSPKLSEEDLSAIDKGFELRYEIIEKCIERSIEPPQSPFEEQRLNLLANLIANGQLDIKVAFLETNNRIGMFHEKMGLISDKEKNVVAFTGSMNETLNAFSHNYESIDVFCSWTHDSERVFTKENVFNALWNDYEPNVKIMDFPRVAKEKFQRLSPGNTIDHDLDRNDFLLKEAPIAYEPMKPKWEPRIPSDVNIRSYQTDAIDAWESEDFRGIFDMATGTGKTYTGLAAVERLYRKKGNNLAVFIVAPYQHLVDQWVADIEKFGMKAIIGHSASIQNDWEKRLSNAVRSFNLNIANNFCFVCTNATFATEFVQKKLLLTKGNVLLMVDEAHNFGATNLSGFLSQQVPFRLALSATIERYGDEEGTEKLFNYFGNKCIEYTLKQAIDNNMLTPYEYFPLVVSLSENELAEYIDITRKIYGKTDEKGKRVFSDYEKMLLIKRARLVAGAVQKIDMLIERFEAYRKESHILVYCGATTINDPDYFEGTANETEIRQIDLVADLLGNKLGMSISKFTSEESANERDKLKRAFDEGKHLQALVAMRCLDEGVNIPSIRTAFIMASSTNPKEYIQRRGRVLRKFPGKSKAVIYDFITLPVPIEKANEYSLEEIKSISALALKEIDRMRDFARISENPWAVDSLINQIEDAYNLNAFKGGI